MTGIRDIQTEKARSAMRGSGIIIGLLLPQWFLSPMGRKAHGGWVNRGIAEQQELQVTNESVLRVDGVEPVGDAAELGIEGFVWECEIRYPLIGHRRWRYGLHRIRTIPDAGMVGTMVAQGCQALQPTGQESVMVKAKVTSHQVLQFRLVEVVEQLRQNTKRYYFQGLPYRWQVWFGVLVEMLTNVSLTGTPHLFAYRFKVLFKAMLIDCFLCIHKPERATCGGNVLDDFRANCNLNGLNGSEEYGFQVLVETIATKYLVEMAVREKCVGAMVGFQMKPIVCQSKVTDGIEGFLSSRLAR